MSLFRQHGMNPRGDLGQNFLIDVNLIEFVVRHAELGPRDVALEVGTGTGGMTAFLAKEAGHVISVDIDKNMSAMAAAAVEGRQNVTLVNRDILRNKNTLAPEITDLIRQKVAERPHGRLKLVANLPYSVGTPVISNLVASDLPWERMVCTIQWELAEKMAAEGPGRHYAALSAWIQSQASVRILRRLGPNVFWPRPKVDSAIVSIWRNPAAAERIHDRRFFQDFLRRIFSQRRKHLRSVLSGMYRKQLDKPDVDQLLTELSLAADQRAELMQVADLINLSNALRTTIQQRGLDPDTDTDPEIDTDTDQEHDTDTDQEHDTDTDQEHDTEN
jgi:16S rRNA (adenine1518-N6/adenine1519-N6)-dimethyltransferase